MLFNKFITLKDGRECLLRNGEPTDAVQYIDYFVKAHEETDYLTTYPDETPQNTGKTTAYLAETKQSEIDVEIVAVVDGKIVGSAGIHVVKDRIKVKHRAEFGISILKDYWNLGIGKALMEASIECAKKVGYLQIELDVVKDNETAYCLYRKYGFVDYGCNPRGFRTKEGQWQELVLMRLEL